MRTSGFYLVVILCLLLGGRTTGPVQAQSATQSQGVVVEGTLVGHDGQPMSAAHVSLYRFGVKKNPFALTTVSSDGSFRLTADTTGVFSIWLTGTNHHPISIPFLGTQGERVTLDVQLDTYRYAEEFDDAGVIGEFNNWDFEKGTFPLKKQETGTYEATVPAEGDSLAYQLINVDARDWRSINGTMADRFVYDRQGDYRSVVAAPEDSVTVTFDPEELVRDSSSTLSITFPDSSRTKAHMLFQDRLQKYEEEAKQDRSGSSRKWQRTVEIGTTFAERHPLLHNGLVEARGDTLLRSAMYLTYAYHFQEQIRGMAVSDGQDFARRLLEQVPPSSLAWEMVRFRDLDVNRLLKPEEARAYLSKMKNEHPDADQRAEAREYLEVGDFGSESVDIGSSEKRVDYELWPVREYRGGHRLLYTESIGEESSVYASSMFPGKVMLVSTVASWCTECIQTVQDLRPVYEKHREDFAMLNVSFDGSVEKTRAVQEEHALPGLYGWVQAEDLIDLRSYFEGGPPRFILVGPTGRVLGRWESVAPGTVETVLNRIAKMKKEIEEGAQDEAED